MAFPEDLIKPLRKILEKSRGRPVSTRELMERLEVKRHQRRQFRSWLKELARRGELVRFAGAKWTLPREEHLVDGVVECHPDGYAFLRPDDPDWPDVFIAPGDQSDAMHGDRVRLRVTRSKKDGRKSGRVMEVLERGTQYIVGKYGKGYVYPVNERIQQRVFVPGKLKRGAVEGELVEVRVNSYPEDDHEMEGEVLCRLGSIDDPGVDMSLVMADHNLPREFPGEALDEARSLPDKVLSEEYEGRKDLRELPLFTVDPESARDFDDAVYVKRERSGWRLWVAIADVSHYVKPGSDLDSEALERATSVYFPETVIPMLPEEVSAGIASLKPDVDRLAMAVELKFSNDAVRQEVHIYPAVMRSSARLSYNQVRKAVLEEDLDERERIGERIPDLEVAMELARALRKKRHTRGSLDFDLPEALVVLGEEGEVQEILRSRNDPSHQMIEEFMLAANEAIARYMEEHELPSLYRIHEPPQAEKMEQLIGVLGAFGLQFDYTDIGERDLALRLQKVLKKAEGKSYEPVVHQMVLRSMMQARYSPRNLGHFGLAADHYLHFTSPIRRYPDLFVHRVLKNHLAGRPVRAPENIQSLASQCSQMERRAEEAERDMDKIKAARFMKARVGQEYEGYIVGVTTFGLFVEIIEHFVEGLVHESRLPPDSYGIEPNTMSLVGKHTKRSWRVGDRVRVTVTGASIEKRQVDFDLVLDEDEAEIEPGAARISKKPAKKKPEKTKKGKPAGKKGKRRNNRH